MSALTRIAAFLAAAALSPAALAAEASMDKADVVWMLVSTTLVLFMTIPGIALFYGGMARKKNVLSILAQTTVICCALTLVWFACVSQWSRHQQHVGLHSDFALRLLPDDVRDSHGYADDRRLCGPHEVLGDAGLHDPLVAVRLFTRVPLGLGRRRILLRHGRA